MQGTATSAFSTPKTPTPPNIQAEYVHRRDWKAGVLGALNVLVLVTAIRITLLCAVLGAVILTFLGIQAPEPLRLGALAVYAALVVIPLIWLAARR
jgi:hypothetical protein